MRRTAACRARGGGARGERRRRRRGRGRRGTRTAFAVGCPGRSPAAGRSRGTPWRRGRQCEEECSGAAADLGTRARARIWGAVGSGSGQRRAGCTKGKETGARGDGWTRCRDGRA